MHGTGAECGDAEGHRQQGGAECRDAAVVPRAAGLSTAGKMSPAKFHRQQFLRPDAPALPVEGGGNFDERIGEPFCPAAKPAGAFWWDSRDGNTSIHEHVLPADAAGVGAAIQRAGTAGAIYRAKMEPAVGTDGVRTRGGRPAGEGTLEDEKTPTFDHTVTLSKTEGYENIMPTPYGNQLLLEFALAALEGEHLGQGPQPDVLCVSFSSVDYCGHRFGPYSQEVQDILRCDWISSSRNSSLTAVDQKVQD